jgi:hypothetical protein
MQSPYQLVSSDDFPPDSPEALLGPLPDGLPRPMQPVTSPKSFTARRLGESIWRSFEMIGGDQALALWADRNRSKFYTSLFARMLPQGTSPALADNAPRVFRLSVPTKVIDFIDEPVSDSDPDPA